MTTVPLFSKTGLATAVIYTVFGIVLLFGVTGVGVLVGMTPGWAARLAWFLLVVVAAITLRRKWGDR